MISLDDYERRLLDYLLADVRKRVPKSLCPTFYRTLSYEGDCELKERADILAEKLGLDVDKI